MYFPWTLRVVGEVFSSVPAVRWLGTGMPCQVLSGDDLLNFQQVGGYSRRAFFARRYKEHGSFIQQEGCFWRRELWQAASAQFDPSLGMAGDLDLWARFWHETDLYSVGIPLGMFRYHSGQKTSSMERYLQEARQVMKKHHRPLPFPQFILCLLAYLLKRLGFEKNWFGVGARRLYYSRTRQRWEAELTFRTF
jgi:hypothetical protein